MRTWTATGGVAAALGPVVGGLLVAISWRWVFLVNVPVGIIALVVGWRHLPHIPGHPAPRPDALGALLVTGGVGALTFGLVMGGNWGWGSTSTIAVLAAAAGPAGPVRAGTARGPESPHRPVPVPHPQLLGVLAGGPGLLRLVRGHAALHRAVGTGRLGLVGAEGGTGHRPGPAMVPLFSFLVAGRLIARFGPGRVIALGTLIFAAVWPGGPWPWASSPTTWGTSSAA